MSRVPFSLTGDEMASQLTDSVGTQGGPPSAVRMPLNDLCFPPESGRHPLSGWFAQASVSRARPTDGRRQARSLSQFGWL